MLERVSRGDPECGHPVQRLVGAFRELPGRGRGDRVVHERDRGRLQQQPGRPAVGPAHDLRPLVEGSGTVDARDLERPAGRERRVAVEEPDQSRPPTEDVVDVRRGEGPTAHHVGVQAPAQHPGVGLNSGRVHGQLPAYAVEV